MGMNVDIRNRSHVKKNGFLIILSSAFFYAIIFKSTEYLRSNQLNVNPQYIFLIKNITFTFVSFILCIYKNISLSTIVQDPLIFCQTLILGLLEASNVQFLVFGQTFGHLDNFNFIVRIQPMMSILLSILILKERLECHECQFVILIFSGFMISLDLTQIFSNVDNFLNYSCYHAASGCISIALTQVVIRKLTLLKQDMHSNLFYTSLIGVIFSIILIVNNQSKELDQQYQITSGMDSWYQWLQILSCVIALYLNCLGQKQSDVNEVVICFQFFTVYFILFDIVEMRFDASWISQIGGALVFLVCWYKQYQMNTYTKEERVKEEEALQDCSAIMEYEQGVIINKINELQHLGNTDLDCTENSNINIKTPERRVRQDEYEMLPSNFNSVIVHKDDVKIKKEDLSNHNMKKFKEVEFSDKLFQKDYG